MGEFRMPSLGADMDRGTVAQWLVKPGDTVHRGEIVAVVDTDKADIDVEIFEDGTVEELLVPEGTEVAVGTPLARIAAARGAPEPRTPPPGGPPPVESQRRSTPVEAPETSSKPSPPATPLSPIIRKLAHDRGVDLARVTGTGPGGSLTRADVERAAAPEAASGRSGAGPRVSPRARRLAADRGIDTTTLPGTGPSGALTGADVERLPIEETSPGTPRRRVDRSAAMRAAIARAMARSKREIPHYYLAADVDFSLARAFLDARNEARPVTQRVLPAALLLKATALAVRKTPELNGYWTDDELHQSDVVNVGVAISLRGGGLVAAAIHDTDAKGLDDLMAGLRDLVTRARAGSLRASEMSDPTITVTNLGEQGVRVVHGVIYPPQVALVGFGAITERPWAAAGMIGARPAVTVTLAADHRASDGARGARLLNVIDRLLQKPEEL